MRRDVEGEDLKGQLLKGTVFPFGPPIFGQGGDLFWDEQAAVLGEPLENDIFEGQLDRLLSMSPML